MARRGPAGVQRTGEYGTIELVPDRDRPGSWILLTDGRQQSYVDTDDPRQLRFGYVRRFRAVVDAAAPAGRPLTVLHLGGGALTLPRYVAATRPGSTQRVVEHDAVLIDMVREHLPLPRGADVRVRAADARAVVESTRDGRFDLVVSDVFDGGRMPRSVASTEFYGHVARILRPGGLFVANVTDGPPMTYTRTQAATLAGAFGGGDTCLLTERSLYAGNRHGNSVLIAAAGPLPVAEYARDASRDPEPWLILHGNELTRFTAGARAMTDATATDSPPD
ncbi:spermidine synthase [Virgisporangium aliadipatigenens]|nr:fused MFS/spermidine synthase [Virgisporangium aliadipatigenens]